MHRRGNACSTHCREKSSVNTIAAIGPSNASMLRQLSALTRDIKRVLVNNEKHGSEKDDSRARHDAELRDFEKTKIGSHILSYEWLAANDSFTQPSFLELDMANRRYEIIYFSEYLNIQERHYNYLCKHLENFRESICLTSNVGRKYLSLPELLALEFKFLSTGEIPCTKRYCLKTSEENLLKVLCDVCQALYNVLEPRVLRIPDNEKKWTSIQNEFQSHFNLPECLGIIVMRRIVNNNSKFNKEQMDPGALVMTAIIDAKYNFLYADVTEYNCHPYYIFKNSIIRKHIENNYIKIPGCQVNDCVLHYFIGHAVMPLRNYLLTSYVDVNSDNPNYRTSRLPTYRQEVRFCSTVDHAMLCETKTLITLSNMFPILKNLNEKITIPNVRKIVLCCIALYNYCRKYSGELTQVTDLITDPLILNGEEIALKKTCFRLIPFQVGNTAGGNAKRDALMSRF